MIIRFKKYSIIFEKKLSEKEFIDKYLEYSNYEDMFAIFDIEGFSLSIGKFISCGDDINGYFAKFELYEWDDFYKGYNVDPCVMGLEFFNILNVYDDIKKAEKELEFYQKTKKYNL